MTDIFWCGLASADILKRLWAMRQLPDHVLVGAFEINKMSAEGSSWKNTWKLLPTICQARDLSNVQSISVRHVIGIAVDDSDGSPLNCLYLFCLCFGDEVVPNWSRVFQDCMALLLLNRSVATGHVGHLLTSAVSKSKLAVSPWREWSPHALTKKNLSPSGVLVI